MLIDIGPLKKYRDYRLLFMSQLVSFFGTMISYVAIPYQVYELTKSSWMVGLLGSVQLIPVVLFGLLGGAYADKLDRRKLLIGSEIVMSAGVLVLFINSTFASPSLVVIFVATALIQSALGFHRPAMDAMTQKMVTKEDMASVSALGSFRYSVGSIAGPALGGILIAGFGSKIAYLIDFGTFVFSVITIWMMSKTSISETEKKDEAGSIAEGLRYAIKRPELVGTYVVDVVAMTFAFTTALFPAMAEQWGGAKAAGALFSAMSIGALVMTVFSGWARHVKRHGAAVIIAAGIWGVAMIGVGFSYSLEFALLGLAVAGAADMVSGMFRGTIWNQTIPNEMRGRLSGIEMISYMSGPLIGNARAGWVASVSSTHVSIVSGGILCVIGVVICGFVLPQFWRYTQAPEVAPLAGSTGGV
ncbi:MAG: MFS transporter [Bdellovibrionota bacterium]